MARGNQRDKAREKAQKAQAGIVCTPKLRCFETVRVNETQKSKNSASGTEMQKNKESAAEIMRQKQAAGKLPVLTPLDLEC